MTTYRSRCRCLSGNPPILHAYSSIEEWERNVRNWDREWEKLVTDHEEKCRLLKEECRGD